MSIFKTHNLLYIFLSLLPLCMNANNMEGVFELDRNSKDFLLTENCEFLQNFDFSTTFDSLKRFPDRFKFRAYHGEQFNSAETGGYWLRFKVMNMDVVPLHRFVSIYQRSIERAQLFVVDEKGQIDTSRMIGSNFPYGTQYIPTVHSSFPFIFEPLKTYTLYVYLEQCDAPIATPIYLYDTKQMLPIRTFYWRGFLVGLGAFYVILSFIMFLFMRTPLYLAFFIYSASGVAYLISATGFGYLLIWSNFLLFESISDNVFGCLSSISLVMFTVCFFDTAHNFPTLDKFFKINIGFGLVLILVALCRKILPAGFYLNVALFIVPFLMLAMLLLLFVACMTFYKTRGKDVLVFIFGFSSYFLTAIVIILNEIGFSEYRYLAHFVMPNVTLFFELTTLLLILSYRIKEEWISKQLEALQLHQTLSQQRQRISSDLHDDVGSTLTGMSVFIEIAKQQLSNLDAAALPTLNRVAESSRQLSATINDIVWAVNPKNDQFENIILKMRFFSAELMARKDILVSFNDDLRLNEINLIPERRKNFYLIFKEAVNNIYKYAECDHLIIDIQLVNENICMKLTDNGRGFDSEKIKKGNGLNFMQSRAAELGGELTVTSIIGTGTTVNLYFPVKNDSPLKILPERVVPKGRKIALF